MPQNLFADEYRLNVQVVQLENTIFQPINKRYSVLYVLRPCAWRQCASDAKQRYLTIMSDDSSSHYASLVGGMRSTIVIKFREALRHGPSGPGPRASAIMRASSRSRLSLNKIVIRIISTVKCYSRLYSPKNWKFQTICQMAVCDDHRPCKRLGLPPYTIITHSVKRRQLIEPVCAT
ncbi:hypothetical protein TNCV_3602011 [Trichonephila clavipes]|nr:hypothetical protein TNCV_3602011 [Trichonephila clavipes]